MTRVPVVVRNSSDGVEKLPTVEHLREMDANTHRQSVHYVHCRRPQTTRKSGRRRLVVEQ